MATHRAVSLVISHHDDEVRSISRGGELGEKKEKKQGPDLHEEGYRERRRDLSLGVFGRKGFFMISWLDSFKNDP